MKDYPVRMTLGQAVFVTICLLVIGFITFYLGARFGPEVFWNIQVDRLAQESLLPSETSEAELTQLLNEVTSPQVTFHEELQKDAPSLGPLEDSKKDPVPLLVSQPKDAATAGQSNASESADPAAAKTLEGPSIEDAPKALVKEAASKKEDAAKKETAKKEEPKKAAVKTPPPPEKKKEAPKPADKEAKPAPKPKPKPAPDPVPAKKPEPVPAKPQPASDPIQKEIQNQEVIW